MNRAMKIISHISRRISSIRLRIYQFFDRKRALRYKNMLAVASRKFTKYPEVLFVFQCHNASRVVGKVLGSFVDLGCMNIVVFADGCHDLTAARAKELLPGSGHMVVVGNDIHEIKNYRSSLYLARHLGCKHVVLLQDDDIYSDVQSWVDESLAWFSRDPRLAMIGLCGASDLTENPPRRADDQYSSAKWFRRSENGQVFSGLAGYYEFSDSKPLSSEDLCGFRYAAIVNRAPQILSVDAALSLGYFPESLEPYQYDDLFNCFATWENGWRVGYLPIAPRVAAKEGGMRLYNAVTKVSRPTFLGRNFNWVLDRFYQSWASGRVAKMVDVANKSMPGS